MSRQIKKKNDSAQTFAGVFLACGAFALVFSIFLEMQVAAFIGLGLIFWGAVLALTRSGRYVESTLLDSTAHSTYSSIDRMINDLKYSGQSYYIPAYPKDVVLPEFLKNLKEPVVFISEGFDGKPSIDELASGKFISTQSRGFFLVAPGSGILTQVERNLQLDLSKISLEELSDVLPKCLTQSLNLARNANLTLVPNGATFKATGVLYDSLYNQERPKSVNLLGCPVVSSVACSLAKTSGKTVVIKEQNVLPNNSVNAVFGFM